MAMLKKRSEVPSWLAIVACMTIGTAHAQTPREPLMPGSQGFSVPSTAEFRPALPGSSVQTFRAMRPGEVNNPFFAPGTEANPQFKPAPEFVFPLELTTLKLAGKQFGLINSSANKVALNYWDAAGKWQELSLDPASYKVVACSKCESEVFLSLHDTKKKRTYKANLGNLIYIGWSAQEQCLTVSGAQEAQLVLNK